MIVVTGGTGFVGSHLIPRLLSQGQRVRCLVRKAADAQRLQQMGVDVYRGDLMHERDFNGFLAGADAVINLVTIIRETAKSTFRDVNYAGPLRLLRASETYGVRRFIHISALGNEAGSHLPYLYYKRLLEKEIERSPIDYTILRTSLVFGKGDQSLSFFAWFLGVFPLVCPIPGNGQTLYHPIWVEDLVTCILKSVMEGSGSRKTLDVGGGTKYYNLNELIDILMQVTGRKRRKLHVPKLAVWPITKIIERVMTYPPITSEMLRLSQIDSVAPLDTVKRHFGFTPSGFDEQAGYLRDVGMHNLRAWLSGRTLTL